MNKVTIHIVESNSDGTVIREFDKQRKINVNKQGGSFIWMKGAALPVEQVNGQNIVRITVK